jgi:hypothetical protein
MMTEQAIVRLTKVAGTVTMATDGLRVTQLALSRDSSEMFAESLTSDKKI